MEAKEKGLLFLPRFFFPVSTFPSSANTFFSPKRDWGLFFLPASRAVEEEDREKRKAGKREKSGKVFFEPPFPLPSCLGDTAAKFVLAFAEGRMSRDGTLYHSPFLAANKSSRWPRRP